MPISQEQKNWLTYWKKSLSDSLKTNIIVKELKHFEVENFSINTQAVTPTEKVNDLINSEEERINNKKGITDRDSEDWSRLETIQILIAPIKIVPLPERLVFLRDESPIYPFWYYATINRLGKLTVPEELFPVFQRKFLEPLADERTEFIFSSVDKVDQATSLGKEEYKSFTEYTDYIKTVFQFATDQPINNYKVEGYNTIFNGVIVLPNEDINAAIGIIHLYEKILKESSIPTLLADFINLNNSIEHEPLQVLDFIRANVLHLGQMGFDFPLSVSQRKSLYTFLQSNSKVFAVNGPPGTGKTTLLQSIVANKMVERAIASGDPPIILACSTNNQAVTNIIDSFSRSNTRTGSLQGRWLPDIDGYAAYLPASTKTEAELQGINYKKLNGAGIFAKVENHTYLEKAKGYYLEKASAYLGSEMLSIEDTIKKLQREISNMQSSLKEASLLWNNYLQAEKTFSSSYINEGLKPAKYYATGILSTNAFEADIADLIKLEKALIVYFKTESIFRQLFCFLGVKSALKNREAEIRIILRDSLIVPTKPSDFEKSNLLELIGNKIQTAKTIIKAITEWLIWKQESAIKGNPPKTEEEYWECEKVKINALRKQDVKQSEPNCFYDELDVILRHKAFQLALHYWEGRWLLKLETDLVSDLFVGKNEEKTKNRWVRQAMLTPCFVSTFYMAPKFFSSSKFLLNTDNGTPIFDCPPLFDFIDLLIVDEAGQVSPEVGVATFSLAKQAIIVGDIKQIEPVWNITTKIDVGNLKREGLIKDYEDLVYENEFDPKGFLASTGSIMKMAQNACNYKEKGLTERGLLLVEHRRCYDEIISYCNVLAYNGQLKPLKGKAASEALYPPMYCVHVEGSSTTINTSRYNINEVMAIVNWLKRNKEKIEAKYGRLENAVGIITPFVGQKSHLQIALKKTGFDTRIMKIGTVHALQGAERNIVLFSTVYGENDSGTMFFDRDNKPNLLNVAVSRAKDSFIVFANTKIFNRKAKTPSGILSNYLTYDHSNMDV